ARVINEDGTAVRIEDYVSRYYYYNLCFECWIYHPTIMCRKDALESVGGYTIPYAEEYELFWQLSRRYLIWNLEEVLLDYRISSGSLHKVVKKVEYDEALLDLLQRNIRYYVGDLKLSGEELECLRHNFQPLLNRNSIAAVVNCLEKLEKITEKILHTENVNHDAGAIREAAYHKRKFIINFFARNFSKWKGFLLLIRLGQWKLLQKLAKEHLGRLS
ncbi:MAG TPA: hypothetical protein VJT83_05010, partial [Chitinophagaceae bacterium]|nr:hypothetical protein [Chitinophagaceae bacterium]